MKVSRFFTLLLVSLSAHAAMGQNMLHEGPASDLSKGRLSVSENRREKGFTVIQAVLLAELDGLRTPTVNGEVPLFDLDPTKPNERYFAFVDSVIRIAASKGLIMGLLPTWGDKVEQRWGEGPQVFNADNAFAYGKWLGVCNR